MAGGEPDKRSQSPGSDSDAFNIDIFKEPEGYYRPPPEPTTQIHTLQSGRVLTLRLVGHSPLWGHHLWQAGRLTTTYLENHPSLFASKNVLELGAGAGLPSLTCAVLGAKKVVVTDYPDPDLISNLWTNIETAHINTATEKAIVAEGFRWGSDPEPLLKHLLPSSEDNPKFDLLILADIIYSNSQHGKIVTTIQDTLSKTKEAEALVFFTPYQPWLYEKNLGFFDLVKGAGFSVEQVLEVKMEKVMFEEDPGDEELRKTVFGFVVKWKL